MRDRDVRDFRQRQNELRTTTGLGSHRLGYVYPVGRFVRGLVQLGETKKRLLATAHDLDNVPDFAFCRSVPAKRKFTTIKIII